MRKKKTETIVYNDYDKYLDADLIALVKNKLGADSDAVLNEMTDIIKLESNMPPMLDKGKTYGDWNLPALSMYYTGDYRPSDALPLDVINQMLKSSPVRFALEMKRAQVVSVFRNSRSWDIVSPDTELAEVVKANLQTILPKMSLDFSFSSMAYGASFQELVWEYKSKYELGISEDDIEDTDAKPTDNNKANELEDKVGSDKKFIVAKIPNSINPATIVRINRKKDGSFDGFVQQAKTFNAQEVVVPREASLVIPYEEKFRNLWGESLLKPMYPIWFWYEVVLRAMVKYMERTGTPVALVRAPSRATIIKPGTKTKVDGITWGMEIASNVARSNAAVIPSDTDDSGKPLWDLSYLNSTERSQPFLDILELLTQMILRAGLSADRALSQSSGGTGSYAIGKVHQEATSLHNEMVLIQWVHYLNTYFLPLYSLYNRGQNGPPIWMETQGLDPMDRENLVALLGIAQGMPAFQEVGYKIDWEAIFATNNIPMKSQAEADAIKKKQEEENLAKQEAMLSTQAKFNTPSPTKQADGTLKANMPNKPAEDKKSDANVKAEDQSESFLDNQQEEVIQLFNPFHSKADGKFTSGKTGIAGGSITGQSGEITNYDDVVRIANNKSKIGGIVKTTGLALGIGGAGLVGFAILDNKLKSGNKTSLTVGGGDSIQDLIDKGIISESDLKDLGISNSNELSETEQAIVSQVINDGNTDADRHDIFSAIKRNREVYSNQQEAFDAIKTDLEKLGYDFPSTLGIVNDEIGFLDKANVGAAYHPLLNQIVVTSDQKRLDSMLNDPSSYDRGALIHEILHAGQESSNPKDFFGVGGPFSALLDKGNKDYIEGNNELMTKMYMLDKYGDYGNSDGVYYEQTSAWAGLAVVGAKKYNITPQEFVHKYHQEAFNQEFQNEMLSDIFPQEVGKGLISQTTTGTTTIGYVVPSNTELKTWLDKYYSVNTDNAYDELVGKK